MAPLSQSFCFLGGLSRFASLQLVDLPQTPAETAKGREDRNHGVWTLCHEAQQGSAKEGHRRQQPANDQGKSAQGAHAQRNHQDWANHEGRRCQPHYGPWKLLYGVRDCHPKHEEQPNVKDHTHGGVHSPVDRRPHDDGENLSHGKHHSCGR